MEIDAKMTKLKEQLLDAPYVKLLIQEVNDELKKEEVQRKAFYDWVREDQKAEFINGEVILHSPVMRSDWRAGFKILVKAVFNEKADFEALRSLII